MVATPCRGRHCGPVEPARRVRGDVAEGDRHVASTPVILLIDNYDSFVHNLARYFQRLGQETRVMRNDAVSVADIRRMQPAAIILSPGPCTPSEAGCSLDVV